MRIVVSIIAASLLSGCAYTSQVAPDTVEKANAHLDRVEKDRKPQWSEDEKKRLAGLFSDNPEYVALALHDDVEDSVTIPRLRTSVPPKYPFGLWVTDTKALVKVAFIISAAGLVEDARIYEASDARFSDAAIDSVRAWTFHPGTRNNVAAKFLFVVPVQFVGKKK
jgi:TonB family protein